MASSLPMKKAPMFVFSYPNQKARMKVRRSQIFVVFGMDGSVGFYDPQDAGTFEVDVQSLAPDAQFPVVIMAIPRKEETAFRSLPQAAVTDMLKTLAAHARGQMQ